MVCLRNVICASCGVEKFMDINLNVCPECKKNLDNARRESHFIELSALSTEQRLHRLELFVYEHTHRGLVKEERLEM